MVIEFLNLIALRANAKRLLILAAALGLGLWPPYDAQAQSCHIGARQRCTLETNHQSDWLRTSYTILSVDYVPPGTGSYVEYGVGGQVGTTVSTTSSWQDSFQVERGLAINFQGVTVLSAHVSYGNDFGGSTGTSIDQKAAYLAATRINGPGGDDLNHDYDQIFLALGVIVRGETWQECTDAWQYCEDTIPPSWTECDCLGVMVPKLRWTIDASSSLPQIVLVGWLKGTLPMPDNVRATLEANGVTPDDYPQMLAADPFANDPTGATPPDPARFVPVTSYPYENIADTFFYQNTNNFTSTSTSGSSTSHTVKVTAGGQLLPLKVSGSFTWKHDSQQSVSSGTSNTETFLLAMPSADYAGPTDMYLYIDKIYKTFMVSPIGPF